MAFRIVPDGEINLDQNLGTAVASIIQDRPGVIQVDGVIRLNRSDFKGGKSPLECLTLEDRYYPSTVGKQGLTYQQSLGYPAANFINPDDIAWAWDV